MTAATCEHCGLPVRGSLRRGQRAYCCYGCLMVSRIVGAAHGDGVAAWRLLRLAVGAVLAMEVMMISLLLYTHQVESSAEGVFRWVLLVSSAPAMLLLAPPLAMGAAAELRSFRLSLDALVATGSLAAFGLSAANVIRGQGQIYFDTATMLPVLVAFGKMLEATARSRARQLARGLAELLPSRALRVTAGGLQDVPAASLSPGDLVRVRPGERIAVDGLIVEGATRIEESVFTGQSQTRQCGVGDSVMAGTVNGYGGIVVAAQSAGEASLLGRIAELVRQSQGAPPARRLAQRAADWFTPAVLALALAAGLAWWHEGSGRAVMVMLAVLVVACPCAMGIAAPLATATAIARAARRGVLVRGGDVLERIGQMQILCLDKTGTLTAGRQAVTGVQPLDGTDETELLTALAGLESASEHALGRAIVAEARRRGLAVPAVEDFQAIPGRGVQGTVTTPGGKRLVFAGAEETVGGPQVEQVCNLLVPAQVENLCHQINVEQVCNLFAPTQVENLCHQINGSATSIAVGWDGRLRGRVFLVDPLRPDAPAAVAQLRRLGVDVQVVSGDAGQAVSQVDSALGLTPGRSRLGPQEKLQYLRELARRGQVVGMAGDGVNDAPVLAEAAVGIALGAGTDLARQAGNVVLVTDQLSALPWLVQLSRRTRRIIRQNLAWALGYNALALAAAAAGKLHPLLAAVAMVISSLTLVSNSLRLAAFPDREKSQARNPKSE